ncbi:hypothetical protein ACQEU3_11220 [Spirillospora sp. CA-253888]
MEASAPRTSSKPSEADDDARALAELRTDFPGHRVWRSRRWDGAFGDWVATLHDPSAGIEPTLIRPDAATLRTALVREGRRAAEKQRSH